MVFGQKQSDYLSAVKVCGITDAENARMVASYPVSAMGMILHANSPRLIGIDKAKEICKAIPEHITLVGVFVNAGLSYIEACIDEIGLDVVQLHGEESNEFAQSLSKPWVKAIRAKSELQVAKEMALFPDTESILLDPYVKGQYGGTGKRLDQQLWPKHASKPLILAGGLSAENVRQAVLSCRPYAVDLNSGIESQHGVKDEQKLAAALTSLVVN